MLFKTIFTQNLFIIRLQIQHFRKVEWICDFSGRIVQELEET